MFEMEMKLEDCCIDIGDTKAICAIVLLVEYDNHDYIYHVEGIEHGNDDQDDLMTLDKRFMSKDFINAGESYVNHPLILEKIREKTQEEWRGITEPDYDYSEGYEDYV